MSDPQRFLSSGLWVHRNLEITAPEDEVTCFLEGVCHCEGLPLDGGRNLGLSGVE